MLRNAMLLHLARAYGSVRSTANQRANATLFVAGLSYDTNEPVLRDVFASYGKILEVRVMVDRKSYQSLGYGFIRFSNEDEAESALNHMQGQTVHGRAIRLEYARCLRQTDESKSEENTPLAD